MVSTGDFITLRESAIVDLDDAIQHLKKCYDDCSLNEDSFKKIDEIFDQVKENSIRFSEKKIVPSWITGKKGKLLAITLGVSTIVLLVLSPSLQAVSYYYDLEDYPNCINITNTYSENYLKNVTVPPLNMICDEEEEGKGASIGIILLVATTIVSILQGILLFAGEKYKSACDEADKARLQIENKTLINAELQNFFTELKTFEKERTKKNMESCAEALTKVSSHRLVKKLGSKEAVISHLFERVRDQDFHAKHTRLEQDIRHEYSLRSNASKRRSRRRVRQGEKSGDMDEMDRRRYSGAVVSDPIKVTLTNFLNIYDIDYMRIGKLWVDRQGNIADKESAELLYRRPSSTPEDPPFVINIKTPTDLTLN